MAKVLAVNAGSSTLKWKLFDMPSERQLADGLIDRLGQAESTVKIKYGSHVYRSGHSIRNFHEAVADVMTQIKALGLVEHLHEITGVGTGWSPAGNASINRWSSMMKCCAAFGTSVTMHRYIIRSKPNTSRCSGA